MRKTICKKIASHQSGYIGLLAILIGTAAMLFLFMKMYFTPTNIQGGGTATQYERMQSDIDAAKAVSNQMNQKTSETNRVLNNVQ